MICGCCLVSRHRDEVSQPPSSSTAAPFRAHPNVGIVRATKKRNGTKVHLDVDTLGHLLEVLTTPANEQDRAQVKDLCLEVQEATGVNVEVAFADQGYTAEQTARDGGRR